MLCNGPQRRRGGNQRTGQPRPGRPLSRPADGRRNVITITRAGTAHLRRLEELLAEVQDELLAPLSPADRRQLTRLLTRILEHHA